MIKEDLKKHYKQDIEHVLENNQDMECLRRWRKEIIAIKINEGNEIRDWNRILETTEKFYKRLYDFQIETPKHAVNHSEIGNVCSGEITEISVEKIRHTVQSMKRGKAPADDNLIIEMLYETLKIEKSENWDNNLVIILFKEGNASLLEIITQLACCHKCIKCCQK